MGGKETWCTTGSTEGEGRTDCVDADLYSPSLGDETRESPLSENAAGKWSKKDVGLRKEGNRWSQEGA